MSRLLKFVAEKSFSAFDLVWFGSGLYAAEYSIVAAFVISSVGISISAFLGHRLAISSADAGS